VEIEKCSVADAATILALQKRAFVSEAQLYNDFSIQPLVQTVDSLVEEFDRFDVLVARIDGKIVGSIRMRQDGPTCYIAKLIVDPEFQNRGIASALIQTAEQFYAAIKRFELFTGFKSEKNLYLYKKHGYQVFREEQSSPEFSFLFMEKFV